MKLKAGIVVLAVAASLAGCVSESKYDAQVNRANTLQQLNTSLKGEISGDQAQITELQNAIRVSLMNAILFSEGGVQLNAAGKATLDRLAPVFKSLTGQKIIVKGFTDNVPIGPELRHRFADNNALSMARAQDVVAYRAAQGVPPGMMVAQGQGESQPVAPNTTAEGRAKNRRVEMDIVEAN